MTQWNGIKVGGLYKRKGKGSRGAPLRMVLGFEPHGNPYADCVNMLSSLGGRVIETFMVAREFGEPGVIWFQEPGETAYIWNYKAVA
jgi:hypothetical protein